MQIFNYQEDTLLERSALGYGIVILLDKSKAMEKSDTWINSSTLDLDGLCDLYHRFEIPSFQRGYEWNAYNVQRLVYSIYDGREEDTFLGTIQISINDGKAQIVDGRQRLTTVSLFYAVLCKRLGYEPNHPILGLLHDEALSDALGQIAEGKLKQFSTIGNRGDVTRLNRNGKDTAATVESIYLRNACYIDTMLEKAGHFKDHANIDIEKLRKMFSTIFFIVVRIEGKELTQVIRIFDTLNSTGQPLSDEAMFKLRYHSFLLRHYGAQMTSESIMGRINACYDKVETYNHDPGCLIPIKMRDVLHGFRTYLILFDQKKALFDPSDLTLSTLGFFESVFEREALDPTLVDLAAFDFYIDAHIEFYKTFYPKNERYGVDDLQSAIDRVMVDLFAWTRYSSTWALPISLYAYFRNQGLSLDHAYSRACRNVRPLFEALLYYSLIYQKSVKRIKTSFLFDVYRLLPIEDGHKFISRQIVDEEKIRRSYPSFWEKAEQNLYDSYGQAYTLLALLELNDEMKGKKDFGHFFRTVFPFEQKAKRPQIEHIFAKDHFKDNQRLTVNDKSRLNGLGNFVLLEERINKSAYKAELPSLKFNNYQEKSFFRSSTMASVEPLIQEYERALQQGAKLDEPSAWLTFMAKPRFEAMKKTIEDILPLLGTVE